MYRRAHVLLITVAVVMVALAIFASLALHKQLVDPESFLGPLVLRLPLFVSVALFCDLVPRGVWASRRSRRGDLGRRAAFGASARARYRQHWTRDRWTLVVMGIVCFYATYTSYRNLKSFLPFVIHRTYDRELHLVDRALFFGHEPAIVLHDLLGEGLAAHLLSSVYLWFLPLVPIALLVWLVWQRNISFGYWFATSQVIAWTLGTASYYALPTLGPGFEYSWLYKGLSHTGSASLMESLSWGRSNVRHGIVVDAVQSVAGFASLHCAITLLVALMVQYTVSHRWLHWFFWINFGLTVVATLYFGWHYVCDDIAGVVIALLSFYLGALASGQKFNQGGLQAHAPNEPSLVRADAD